MSLKQTLPLVLYDNHCYLCTKFAGIINRLGGKKLAVIGHYSPTGIQLRQNVLDSDALKMFWFIDKKTAYGGRAALLPLLKTILYVKNRQDPLNHYDAAQHLDTTVCQDQCKNVKSVFLRSASLLTRSKKIQIDRSN